MSISLLQPILLISDLFRVTAGKPSTVSLPLYFILGRLDERHCAQGQMPVD